MTAQIEAYGAGRTRRAPVSEWRVQGRATIDDRPAVRCVLAVRADGTWAAQVATFTLAGRVALFMVSAEGGHFCGDADVAHSRADSEPFAMQTELHGAAPLLVVAPGGDLPELDDADVVDGQVVE